MTPNTIHQGDALEVLRTLPDESVQCCITSPPYFGLRDYGTEPVIYGNHNDCDHDWSEIVKPAANGIVNSQMQGETLSGNSATRKPQRSAECSKCGAWRGHLGLEPTIELYLEHMVAVFREVRRVLRSDGILWCNIGDSYASGGRESFGTFTADSKQATHSAIKSAPRAPQQHGIKPKDMCGIPWRLAFALQADGWWLRQDIIWHKPNPMPESVRDRCTKAHEFVFLMTKAERYYFDQEAIKERAAYDPPSSPESIKSPHGQGYTRRALARKPIAGWDTGPGGHSMVAHATAISGRHGKLLPRRCRSDDPARYGQSSASADHDAVANGGRNKRSVWTVSTYPFPDAHFATFPPDLIKPMVMAGSRVGDLVLDPFMGSGTVALVAKNLGRKYIGIELNPDYIVMAEKRLRQEVLAI